MNSRIRRVPVLLRRMPLRTRLILAFVLLIISSASATIVIGNSVFGAKVDELASNVMTLYAGRASQVLQARLDALRRLAQGLVESEANSAGPAQSGQTVGREIPVDFILRVPPTGAATLIESGRSDKQRVLPLSPVIDRTALSPSLLRTLENAIGGRKSVAGFAVHDNKLMAVAAAPLPQAGTGGVLLGYVLSGRTELLEEVQKLVPASTSGPVEVTAFLGTRCVAWTAQPAEPYATALQQAAEGVLRRGGGYSGVVGRDRTAHISYVPLNEVAGGSVGMLGMVNGEDTFSEARNRTTKLFTTLIAGGMVFGFIMTFMFSAWLVSPISQLAEGMTRVSEGDLDYKVRIETADELGTLARAFNQMVRAVKERDHKLRELTESRLTRVEKQSSIGRLAAGVAHEINNPLTAILTLTSLWLRKMSTDDPRRDDLEMVVSETARCRDIVRSLLDFARELPMDRTVVDINSVVRGTVALARNCEPFGGVSLESRLSPAPLAVNADAKLLQQVFLNLLLNAAEAVEPGGTVTVETDEDSSGGFVQVKVIDNGKGIPQEHVNRVFEPFFTTKGTGKGTGLGLSVSAGIVHKHDGTIEIESEEGAGTIVTVLLPRSNG